MKALTQAEFMTAQRAKFSKEELKKVDEAYKNLTKDEKTVLAEKDKEHYKAYLVEFENQLKEIEQAQKEQKEKSNIN